MNTRLLSPLRFILSWAAFVHVFSGAVVIHAQPSGGPYGPIAQKFELPASATHILYVAPDGNAAASGATLAEPTTLETAISRVVTGDAVILRGGTYRTGGLQLNQGVTLQTYADERPVLKGTRVATEWEALRDGVWRTKWKTLFPQKPADWWRRNREGMRTPLHRFNNDMVFIDGRALQSAGWEGELDANKFSIDYDGGYVFIGVDPASHVIEITAYDSALVRTTVAVHGKSSDNRGPIIRGITFTQYAFRALEIEGREVEGPEDAAKFGKDVVGTTLEHVTITHCSRVAGYFRGDRFTLRHCLISDTSTEGIFLFSASDCLLEKNIFARNNVEQITGYYPSAVKIFNQTHRVVCRDNLVIDQPYSNGIWYDVGNVDGIFINNWIEGCLDGFFFEISRNAICAGNVFVNCDKGVRVLNSANVQVIHNTFVNTVASFERTERSAVGDHFGWHPATGPDVDKREGHIFAGNLVTSDASFPKALLRFDQVKLLQGKLTTPQAARIDDNIYVRRSDSLARSLVAWAPTDGEELQIEFKTLDELRRKFPQFETRSQTLATDPASIFMSPDLKNLRLIRRLPVEVATPPEIVKLLGWSEADAKTPGAYPFRP